MPYPHYIFSPVLEMIFKFDTVNADLGIRPCNYLLRLVIANWDHLRGSSLSWNEAFEQVLRLCEGQCLHDMSRRCVHSFRAWSSWLPDCRDILVSHVQPTASCRPPRGKWPWLPDLKHSWETMNAERPVPSPPSSSSHVEANSYCLSPGFTTVLFLFL